MNSASTTVWFGELVEYFICLHWYKGCIQAMVGLLELVRGAHLNYGGFCRTDQDDLCFVQHHRQKFLL